MIKKIEIFLKKIITRIFLNILKAKSVVPIEPITNNSRVVLISLNRIGDALVSTPLLKILKENTGCHITILAGRNNHFVFNGNPHCDDILIYEKGPAGIFKILRKLKKGNYNYIIDLHDDVSTTVTLLIGLCKIRFKCGLLKENKKIYTHTIEKLNPVNHHIVDRMLNMAGLFNLEVDRETANVVYQSSAESLKRVNEFISNNFQNDFLVGINISAGSNARFWGVDRYKSLCKFLGKYNVDVVIISAKKDLKSAEDIASGNHKIFCSSSFDEFAAMISKLNFLFTPDTSAVHLASAFQIPLFGLYARYGTSDMIWSPYKSEFEYMLVEEENLDSLSYDLVISKFKPFFEKVFPGQSNR